MIAEESVYVTYEDMWFVFLLILEVFGMTGKRFLSILAHRGIPASCFAHRLGCNLSSINKLKSYEQVPKHYINFLIREFGSFLNINDLARLNAI